MSEPVRLYWRKENWRSVEFWTLWQNPMPGELYIALVQYLPLRKTWRYCIFDPRNSLAVCGGLLGSADAARKAVEAEIDRRSLGFFDADEVEFIEPSRSQTT